MFLIARGGEGGAWCLASRRSFLLFVAGDFSSLACFVHMSNSFNSTLVPCCGCLCWAMFCVYVCAFFSLSLSFFFSCYPFVFALIRTSNSLLFCLLSVALVLVFFFFPPPFPFPFPFRAALSTATVPENTLIRTKKYMRCTYNIGKR